MTLLKKIKYAIKGEIRAHLQWQTVEVESLVLNPLKHVQSKSMAPENNQPMFSGFWRSTVDFFHLGGSASWMRLRAQKYFLLEILGLIIIQSLQYFWWTVSFGEELVFKGWVVP